MTLWWPFAYFCLHGTVAFMLERLHKFGSGFFVGFVFAFFLVDRLITKFRGLSEVEWKQMKGVSFKGEDGKKLEVENQSLALPPVVKPWVDWNT